MTRILLIEDDDSISLLIQDLLQQEKSHMTFRARDGEAGLQIYAEYKPDVIITDLVMPKKDGLEVIASIRQQNTKIPIFVLSGVSSKFPEAIKKGATACFTKPVIIEELLTEIKNLSPMSF